MINLPLLPAPRALHDPLIGQVQRVARTAAQRHADRDPVAANGGSRLRRDPLRSEIAEILDRAAEETRTDSRYYREQPEVFGRATTNLFFVQQFAQEENPPSAPAIAHEQATSAYPSLGFDDDILLPGDAVPQGWFGTPRLDIVV